MHGTGSPQFQNVETSLDAADTSVRATCYRARFGMTKILMVASEARPFAMTGGLGDVIGSLPAALHAIGENVAVLLPRYRGVAVEGRRIYDDLPVWLGGVSFSTSVYQVGESIPHYFLDCPELYDREGVYGNARGDFSDNHV